MKDRWNRNFFIGNCIALVLLIYGSVKLYDWEKRQILTSVIGETSTTICYATYKRTGQRETLFCAEKVVKGHKDYLIAIMEAAAGKG